MATLQIALFYSRGGRTEEGNAKSRSTSHQKRGNVKPESKVARGQRKWRERVKRANDLGYDKDVCHDCGELGHQRKDCPRANEAHQAEESGDDEDADDDEEAHVCVS
jgi:hypothetical protein